MRTPKRILIQALSQDTGMSWRQCDLFLSSLASQARLLLTDGRKVKLAGFGTFALKRRAPRVVPVQGDRESMYVTPAMTVVEFRPCSELKAGVRELVVPTS